MNLRQKLVPFVLKCEKRAKIGHFHPILRVSGVGFHSFFGLQSQNAVSVWVKVINLGCYSQPMSQLQENWGFCAFKCQKCQKGSPMGGFFAAFWTGSSGFFGFIWIKSCKILLSGLVRMDKSCTGWICTKNWFRLSWNVKKGLKLAIFT